MINPLIKNQVCKKVVFTAFRPSGSFYSTFEVEIVFNKSIFEKESDLEIRKSLNDYFNDHYNDFIVVIEDHESLLAYPYMHVPDGDAMI